MNVTRERDTNKFKSSSTASLSVLRGQTTVFSLPLVSTLTISTTGVDRLPLLQAALLAVFQAEQYITSWHFSLQLG